MNIPIPHTHKKGDLAEAFAGISSDPQWKLKLCIGGFVNYLALTLVCLQPLLIPLSFICLALSKGYLLRAMREIINKENTTEVSPRLPSWDDWLDLIVSGLSFIVIEVGFAFFFLTFFVVTLLIKLALWESLASSPWSVALTIGHFLLLSLLYLGLNLFAFVLMANFAQQESMSSGFQWLKVYRRIKKEPIGFGTAWLVSMALTALAWLSSLTIILALLLPIFYFASHLIGARLCAVVWRSTQD